MPEAARVRLLRRLRGESGFTLVELVAVMSILMTVLTAITSLFLSGAKAELDANRRFQAQQQARIAADRMRREIHCAKGVVLSDPNPADASRYAAATVTVPKQCPTGNGVSDSTVVYDTQEVNSTRFRLMRAGVVIADYWTSRYPFSYTAASASTLAKLNVDASVNVNPNEGWKRWHLTTDIVLRNTVRKD